jgi:hypothetical protein
VLSCCFINSKNLFLGGKDKKNENVEEIEKPFNGTHKVKINCQLFFLHLEKTRQLHLEDDARMSGVMMNRFNPLHASSIFLLHTISRLIPIENG